MVAYRIAINSMATGKLPQGDSRWATFNDSFVNRELTTLDFANEIYTGHAYTTWHNGRRKLDNFIAGQHIAIDLDTGDMRSALHTLEQHPLFVAYGAFAHTTPSHTDEAPRARVVFLLDEPIGDAAGYTAATNFLMSQFDGADTVCKDASRFFYGAENCDIALNNKTLPVAALRTLYRQWTKAHPGWQATTQPANVIPIQRVEEMRHRRQETHHEVAASDELERTKRALASINPWGIDYGKWIAILAALHDEFGDAALPIAEQWSQGKPGEVQRKWKTFGNYSGNRATLASIFGEAKQQRVM